MTDAAGETRDVTFTGRRVNSLRNNISHCPRIRGFDSISPLLLCSSEEDDRRDSRGEDAQEGGERIDGGVGDCGASEPAKLDAKVRAGVSVMLPASRPLRSMKFNLNTARPKMPMSGSTVTHTPASQPLQAGSAEDGDEEFAPAPRPIAAKKSPMPNSRKARLVFTGMCQTWRPMRPKRPKDKRDDKGTAGKAELDRLRQSMECDGQGS